jgi:hypothetical protein
MLAEFNTHRMLSRNSASSRAIPFNKMVKMVQENPFIPIAWQEDHKGMQGTEYIEKGTVAELAANRAWLRARDNAVKEATELNDEKMANVTKQLCNRLLEPFMWHTVIVTSGKEGLDNFYKLRCPEYTHVSDKLDGTSVTVFKSKKDYEHCYGKQGFSALEWLKINTSQADIHIQAIAELMWDAINESTPKQLQAGEWHLPYGYNIEWTENNWKEYLSNIEPLDNVTDRGTTAKIQIATARCARISYETLGDNPKVDYKADIRLHDMLVESGHWSPFEHVARAMSNEEYETYCRYDDGVSINGWSRNFKGFIQYRALIDN